MSGYRPLGSELNLSQPLVGAAPPYAPEPTYPPMHQGDSDRDNLNGGIRHAQYESVDAERQKNLRTPEPTEEELKLLTMKGFTDWSGAKDWRWWVRKEMISKLARLYRFHDFANELL